MPINFPKCVIICICFIMLGTALLADRTPGTIADFYYAQGYYDEAITEYLRFVYFNPEDPQLAEIYHKLSLCYGELEEWEQAERALRKAITLTDDRAQTYAYKFTFIEMLIAKKSYKKAEKELHEIYIMAMEKEYRSRSLFLLAVLYIYTYDWESAEIALKEYFSESVIYSESTKLKIYDLLAAARKLPYKSKHVAILLSLLLPGAGQVYSGNFMQGLNALVVNGAAGTLLVYTIIDGYYLDAAVVFLFIFYRFYSGNIYHAEKLTLQYNELLNRNMAEQLLTLLLEKER